MKILSNIENIDSRYHVQVDTIQFTANEEELMCQFGEPQIDIGSAISGSASRPGQTNTVVVITPSGGGSGATAVPVVDDNGTITAVTVTAGGTGYSSVAISFTGDGTGATATATIAGGIITAITVTAQGSGYHVVPYAVSFTLPPSLRRISSDSPFVQVFDLGDTVDADVQASVWQATVVSRLTAAKAALIAQTSPFVGETMVTV